MPMNEWVSLNEAAHIWLSAFEGLPPADGWKTGQDDMSGLAAENLNADFHKAVAMTNLPLKGIIKAKHGQVPTGPHVDIPATYFRYSRDFRPRLNSIESDNAEQDQTTFEASPLADEHNPDWVEVLVHRDKFTRWIKSSLRGTLLTELKNGRIKKDEAVVIAEARGVNLLTNPNPSEYDPLLEIGWTLAMAVAWIATRDIDIVRDQMNSWRTAKEYLKTSKVLDDDTQKEMEVWNVESSEKASLMLLAYEEFQSDDARLASDSSKPLVSEYHTAIKDLWLKLGNGELVARATVEGHIGQVIEQDRWQYLEHNVADFGQEYVCYKDHQNGGKKWFDVTVPREDVLSIWSIKPNTNNISATSPLQNKRLANRPVADGELHRWFKQYKVQSGALTRDAIEQAGKDKFRETITTTRLRNLYRDCVPHGGNKRGRKSAKVNSAGSELPELPE